MPLIDPKPWEVQKDLSRLSNVVNPQGSFELLPGQEIVPETSKADVFGAAWRTGITGGLKNLIFNGEPEATPEDDESGYNFINDVADEFLNPVDITYFTSSMNKAQTEYRNDQVRSEKKDLAAIQDRPWLFFGASILTDPVGMFLPTVKAGSAMKAGYTAAVALKTGQKGLVIPALKATGKSAAVSSIAFATEAVPREIIQQQVTITKSEADSTFDVVGSAIIGSVLGGIGGAAASAIGIRSAHSHIVNALADIPDTPGLKPKSKVFVMGPIESEIHASNEQVAKTPKWIRDTMKFSDMNHLMESPYQTSNYAANLIYSHPFVIEKNITEGLPTTNNLDDSIFKSMRQYEPKMLDFDATYRQQLGVEGSFGAGMRARVAEAFRKGALNRRDFHSAVGQVLDRNIPDSNQSVNKAAEGLRENISIPIKQELVQTKLMHPRMLDPKFDAYFHRMWQRNTIANDPNGFEKLTRDFFTISDQFYRTNAAKISELNAPVEKTRVEMDKVRKSIKGMNAKRGGKTAKKFDKKTQAKYDGHIKELDDLKARLEDEMDAYYDFMPPEYVPHDGHVPKPKSGIELNSAAKQTLMRLLGTDIEQQTNPFISGAGGADPLQARVFGIPNDFSTTIIDADGTVRTVTAWDFIEKDIHRVFSNLIRRTSSRIESTKIANRMGYETAADMQAGLLESLQDDFFFAKLGKSGKEAEKLTKQFQKDNERIVRSLNTMNNITNAEVNAYSQDAKKYVRAANSYTDTRLLGSAALSSIPDLGTAIMRQNFDTFTSDWLVPFARSMIKLQKNKAQAINKQTAADWGFGIDTEIGKRQKALMNNSDLIIPHAWWGKTAELVTGTFGNASMQNPLNDAVSNMAFSASVSKTMRTIARKAEGGKVSKRNNTRLLAIGLSEGQQKEIHGMWREAVGPNGGKDGTVYYADPGKWNVNTPERADAMLAFENATTRDFRQSIGRSTAGDRIPNTDTTAFRAILKYKDYLFANTQKVLMSNIQKMSSRELDVFLTMGITMSLGSLSYIMTSLAKDPTGESVDLSPGKLFHEALDRSAMLGIVMEPINLFQKTGWLPIGQVSRWQSRGIFGSVLGPTAGVVDDLLITGGKIMQSAYGEREFSQSELRGLMRLLPYQNLFYIRFLNEQLANEAGLALGAKEN